jgi:branched-subunit amino acid transport protein
MTTFLAILVTGLGTYLSRSIFILSLANRRIPPMVRAALEYVAPAVLGALVVTMLVTPEGKIALGYAEVLALATAGAVALRTRNHILTLVAGMAVFWIVRTIT